MTTTRPRSRTAAVAQRARLAATAILLSAATVAGLASAATASPPHRAPVIGPEVSQPAAPVGAPGWLASRPYIALRGGAPVGGFDDLTTEPRSVEIRRKGRIFCSDDDCSWLVSACAANKGGLSTEPDGTQVCTVYDTDD